MRLRFICAGLLALTMVSNTELSAHEDIYAGAHSKSSQLFHSQYNIVEDHPNCNAPDQVAFTVSLERNFIEQFIFDPIDQSSVLITHELLAPSTETTNGFSSGNAIVQKLATGNPADGVCSINVRRGGKLYVQEIPCYGAPSENITHTDLETTWIARLASATLSTEGTAIICMSPSRAEVLEVTGHINATYTQINDGTPALPSDTQPFGTEIHNSSSFDEIGLSVSVWSLVASESTSDDRNEPDIPAIEVDGAERSYHSDHLLRDHAALGGTVVRLSAGCVPLEGLHETTLFMDFTARVGITAESFESCFTSDCPELVMLHDYKTHHHERTPSSCTTEP